MAVLAAVIGLTHLLAGFDNPALTSAVTTLLLFGRLSGHHRYQLSPLGRRVVVMFTKVYGCVLATARPR
jgi:hypothetical protein